MSITRRQLFVGVLDKKTWTNEKLCVYLTKHAITNEEEQIDDCRIMSYGEARFYDKSFAFVTFSKEECVNRCMSQRQRFIEEHGFTIKRLLPDSIAKSQRLISSADIVIRITLPDPLFTETNIRSYFAEYGTILDVKMLEEEHCGGICLITFEDFDSSDRVLIDTPHYLNGQSLSIDKYAAPDYVRSLTQFRPIDENNAQYIERWYPIFRNLHDLMRPIRSLYQTQLALMNYDLNQQVSTSDKTLHQSKEKLLELENQYHQLKQEFLQTYQGNEQLQRQIDETRNKRQTNLKEYEDQLEQHRRTNRALETTIRDLTESAQLSL